MANKESKRLTEVVAKETGRTFCTSCNEYMPSEGGKHVLFANGKGTRWKCGACRKRSAERSQWNWIKGDVNEQRK